MLPILHKLNIFHGEQISTLAFLQILIENLNSDRALGKFASFEDFGGIRCKARQVWLGTTSTLQWHDDDVDDELMTVLDVGGVNGDNDGCDGDYGGGGGGDDDDWWNQMEDPASSGHYNLNTSVTWTI